MDDSERLIVEEILPQLQTVPGFVGVLSLVDRVSGESVGITFWETEEAMRASEAEANRLRGDISEGTGSQIRTVDRYEVSLRAGL